MWRWQGLECGRRNDVTDDFQCYQCHSLQKTPAQAELGRGTLDQCDARIESRRLGDGAAILISQTGGLAHPVIPVTRPCAFRKSGRIGAGGASPVCGFRTFNSAGLRSFMRTGRACLQVVTKTAAAKVASLLRSGGTLRLRSGQALVAVPFPLAWLGLEWTGGTPVAPSNQGLGLIESRVGFAEHLSRLQRGQGWGSLRDFARRTPASGVLIGLRHPTFSQSARKGAPLQPRLNRRIGLSDD